MIVLSKHFSRERSLFYGLVWTKAERAHHREWFGVNVRNFLFLKSTKANLVSVWYQKEEIEGHHAILRKRVYANSYYFRRVKKAYTFYSSLLRPYVEGKKTIQNLAELRAFYTNWVGWWSPMAAVFLLVDTAGIPQRVRDVAFRLRRETQEYADACDRVFLSFFKKQFPRYAPLAFVITPSEVFSLQRSRFTESEAKNIQKRLGGYALLNGKLLTVKDLAKELKRRKLVLEKPITKATARKITELQGVGASKGRVIGRARIILLAKEIGKLKSDEILVASMTSPEFVPAMSRSAAIVTDEGGMTSHAAIVSRELKKPCVIGTKIATQVLKDGDRVEVDADKGVVKILERAK